MLFRSDDMAPMVYIPNYGLKLPVRFVKPSLPDAWACSYPIEYEGVWLDLVYIGFAVF